MIGTPVQGRGVLMVANHTSWLDILVLSAVAPHFLRRQGRGAELALLLAPWPSLQETVFVDRVRRTQTGEARDQIRDTAASAGDALVLFPEGTSNDGNRVLPFKSALMGAAEAEIG